MSQKVNQTKHTVQDNGLETVRRFMQILFSLVQILLVFRLAFKLLGANASNFFVNLIYATTAPLVGLFEGIFPEMVLEGNPSFAVFEPATVIAIVVTAAVSYIVIKLLSVKQDKKIEHVEVQEQTNAIPLGRVSEAQLNQTPEAPLTPAPEKPLTPAPETLEQTKNRKLETESQELEDRIRHQQQILDDQQKMYGSLRDENTSGDYQEQRMDEPVKMYSAPLDVTTKDEHMDPYNDDVIIYEKRRRQI